VTNIDKMHQRTEFVYNTLFHRQPVQVPQRRLRLSLTRKVKGAVPGTGGLASTA
jgi:hypothetical protein